jgi:hypothetical protein
MNVIERIASLAGRWQGTNTLQDPVSGKPDESPSTLTVTPVLGSRFVRIDYTWQYQGQPHEGSLLVGFDAEAAQVTGYWIDTWHMGRKALSCFGPVPADRVIAFKGSYSAPTGPDLGWRIEILPTGDTLRIRHTNISPDGQEDLAVEGVYSRIS